ncbi:unnamed protein product [Sphacelaria rigidula]
MGHIAPFIVFLVSTQHYASAFIVPTTIKSSSHAAPLHRRRTQHGASGVFKSSGVLDTPSALNKCRSVDATRMFSSSSGSNSFGGLESDGSLTTRGGFAKAVAASGLAALLAGAPSVAEGASKRTVVVTGANSGLGLDAATKLVSLGHEVYVACRTEAKAKAAASTSGAAGAFACDLSSLESVRSFAQAWGSKPIDSLCLNAGRHFFILCVECSMAPSTKGSVGYSSEGFEVTVGTNHLGHFLLANLLFKSLEAGATGEPRLIVTASSVHDPDTPGGNVGSKATLGDLSGLEGYLAAEGASKKFDMVDGGEYDGDKAYKDSKLCNVLFTLEAQRRLSAKKSRVKADCFSPGLITSSGLFRNQNPIFSKIFDLAATYILKVAATISQGGDTLVAMVTKLSLEDDAGGRFFATNPGKPDSAFGPQDVSIEARDTEKAKRLWDLSAQCVNLGSKTVI